MNDNCRPYSKQDIEFLLSPETRKIFQRLILKPNVDIERFNTQKHKQVYNIQNTLNWMLSASIDRFLCINDK